MSRYHEDGLAEELHDKGITIPTTGFLEAVRALLRGIYPDPEESRRERS